MAKKVTRVTKKAERVPMSAVTIKEAKGIIAGEFEELKADAAERQRGVLEADIRSANAEKVQRYIARQVEHHRRQTFEEELIALLERHGVEYDRRYVFD